MINSYRRYSRLLFAREFLKHPLQLGAVIPSSRFLVGRMLRQVDWPSSQVLVEYGPGVGTFTTEILRSIRQDAALLAIEASDEFVRHLRRSYSDPRLHVVHGSAAEVRQVLQRLSWAAADVIISGIPFNAMRRPQRERILSETKQALRPGGRFVAFQYSGTLAADLERIFGEVERDLEPLNVFPARIFRALNDAEAA
jgi:phospholipid N-methyltransferase